MLDVPLFDMNCELTTDTGNITASGKGKKYSGEYGLEFVMKLSKCCCYRECLLGIGRGRLEKVCNFGTGKTKASKRIHSY